MCVDTAVWENGFEALMQQLRSQHDSQVRALTSEIERLNSSIARLQPQGLTVWCKEDAAIVTLSADTLIASPGTESTVDDTKPASATPQEADAHEKANQSRNVERIAKKEGAGHTTEKESQDVKGVAQGERADDQTMGTSASTPTANASSKSHAKHRPMFGTHSVHSNHAGTHDPNVEEDRSWRGRISVWVDERLDMIIGFVILLNVIFVYVELERTGDHAGVLMGAKTVENWPQLDTTFGVIAHLFTAIFLLELCLKLWCLRLGFFYAGGTLQKFNLFDAAIVVASVMDLWIISPAFGSRASGSSMQLMRLCRLMRVVRSLRVVRSFEMFSRLRHLVATVVASFFALFWSLVLLSVVMLMAALVMCQSVNLIFLDEGIPLEFKVDFFRYFGTPSRSLWTMFEITFGGGWQKYARPLVEEVSVWWSLFFIVYIAGVIFAMFRIITALFIKDTMSVAAQDAEAVIQDKMKEKARYAEKLLDVFSAADTSGDGYVTWEEFEELIQDETASTYLTTLELDPASAKLLFSMLDDGDNRVSVQEFVKGALRLKGQARSSDVVSIMHDCNKLLSKLTRVEENIEGMLSRIEGASQARRSNQQ